MSRVSKAIGRHKLITTLLGLGVLGSFTMGWAQPALAHTAEAAHLNQVSRAVGLDQAAHAAHLDSLGKRAAVMVGLAEGTGMRDAVQAAGVALTSPDGTGEAPASIQVVPNADGFGDSDVTAVGYNHAWTTTIHVADFFGYNVDLALGTDPATGDTVLAASTKNGTVDYYDFNGRTIVPNVDGFAKAFSATLDKMPAAVTR